MIEQKTKVPNQISDEVKEPMREVLDFLNSIEGAGYGGMASFEIARAHVRDAAEKGPPTMSDLSEKLRDHVAE